MHICHNYEIRDTLEREAWGQIIAIFLSEVFLERAESESDELFISKGGNRSTAELNSSSRLSGMFISIICIDYLYTEPLNRNRVNAAVLPLLNDCRQIALSDFSLKAE